MSQKEEKVPTPRTWFLMRQDEETSFSIRISSTQDIRLFPFDCNYKAPYRLLFMISNTYTVLTLKPSIVLSVVF